MNQTEVDLIRKAQEIMERDGTEIIIYGAIIVFKNEKVWKKLRDCNTDKMSINSSLIHGTIEDEGCRYGAKNSEKGDKE